jgi:aryl-alcohol dehydrogenase-like predicted oxidoreductase
MSMSDVLPMAPAPKSRLARYRLLSPTASVRVSPLCLGGMSFGDAWSGWSKRSTSDLTQLICR